MIFAALLFVWVILTFFMWAMPFEGHPTLVQVLVDQWHWLGQLLRRIW